MTKTTPLEIVIALVAEMAVFAGGALLLWAYAWGNPWYASRAGRAIVTLAACVMLIVAVTLLRYFLHWGVWTAFISYGLTLIAVWTMAITFIRERRLIRRTEQAKQQHRVEGTDT